jgi:hypothetical protein
VIDGFGHIRIRTIYAVVGIGLGVLLGGACSGGADTKAATSTAAPSISADPTTTASIGQPSTSDPSAVSTSATVSPSTSTPAGEQSAAGQEVAEAFVGAYAHFDFDDTEAEIYERLAGSTDTELAQRIAADSVGRGLAARAEAQRVQETRRAEVTGASPDDVVEGAWAVFFTRTTAEAGVVVEIEEDYTVVVVEQIDGRLAVTDVVY